MKSQIIPKPSLEPTPFTYPCLGWVPDTKLVVLFHKNEHGTVVHQQNGMHFVGEYSNAWHMQSFKPCTTALVQIGD